MACRQGLPVEWMYRVREREESEMTSRFLSWASLGITMPFAKMGLQGRTRLGGVSINN